MSENTTPHDNDADSRPRIHMTSTSAEGHVEVCVHGGEGESAEDIAHIADDRLTAALDGQKQLRERDESPDGASVQ